MVCVHPPSMRPERGQSAAGLSGRGGVSSPVWGQESPLACGGIVAIAVISAAGESPLACGATVFLHCSRGNSDGVSTRVWGDPCPNRCKTKVQHHREARTPSVCLQAWIWPPCDGQLQASHHHYDGGCLIGAEYPCPHGANMSRSNRRHVELGVSLPARGEREWPPPMFAVQEEYPCPHGANVSSTDGATSDRGVSLPARGEHCPER